MPARRFFLEDVHAEGDAVAFEGADAHKIANVLRLRTGDRVEIVDSGGSLFDAELRVDDGSVHATLIAERERVDETRLQIDVAQAIPKGAKMDFVVEKLTELGARAIVPFESERTVVREPGTAKLERWRRLARGAAQQSGRRDVPDVRDVQSFDELCAEFAAYDLVLFPWEAADRRALRDVLPELVADARTVMVVVGPEGGFSHDEAQRAQAAGARVVSLGRRILRTESAALVVVAILSYLTD